MTQMGDKKGDNDPVDRTVEMGDEICNVASLHKPNKQDDKID